jgi:hypothetical protein
MQFDCEISECKWNSPVSAHQHEADEPTQQQLQLRYQFDLAAKCAVCYRNAAVKFVGKSPTFGQSRDTARAALHMANLTFGASVTFGFETIWNRARTIKCPREIPGAFESNAVDGEQ